MNYYILSPTSDENGDMMGLIYERDHSDRSYVQGIPFNSKSENQCERPPQEPVVLTIKPGREDSPFPTFLREPVPLLSIEVLQVLHSAGVHNLDVYQAELRYSDGKLASDNYVVFNLIGMIKAVDLEKSKFDSTQRESETCMIFDSVVIDLSKTQKLRMFRMAENVSTILVDDVVKNSIEGAKIQLLKVYRTNDVAIL
jgi:hypothetical protein